MHGRRVEVEDVLHFDLEKSFGLDAEEIRVFMDRAHSAEEVEAIPPAPGAIDVLDGWAGDGHSVRLVTGRPPLANAASRRWLERHAIAHDALHHLDKWSRPSWNDEGLPAIGFDALPAMDFAFAVEDSLDTAVKLVELLEIPVALVDRPWNRDLESEVARPIRSRLVRCGDWQDVARAFAATR